MRKLWILGTVFSVIAASGCQVSGSSNVVDAVVPTKVELTDIEGHWAKNAILNAVQKGYVDGFDDFTFLPDQKLTRAEYMKMAVKALQLNVSEPGAGDSWYTPYVNAAVNAGIHRWSDFSTGNWNTPINRFEMARIALRASNSDYRPIDASTQDNKMMYDATKLGLIQGVDDYGTLASDGETTRAQSVTVIERILTAARGEKIGVSDLQNQRRVIGNAEIDWHGTNVFTMWPRYFSEKDINKFPDMRTIHWDSSDGIYHEEVEYYVVVDMEDPNDPHRKEVEGLQYAFWDDQMNYELKAAPEKSYVTFTRMKQVVNGQYPKSLYVADGGYIHVSNIVPEAISKGELKGDIRELIYNLEKEKGEIQGSHLTEGQKHKEWNIAQGNSPFYVNQMPSTGGTFHWVTAEVHPKGDFFSLDGRNIILDFRPNKAYSVNYGPKSNITQFYRGSTDYTKENP